MCQETYKYMVSYPHAGYHVRTCPILLRKMTSKGVKDLATALADFDGELGSPPIETTRLKKQITKGKPREESSDHIFSLR